jgi:hypothetical protein
MPPYSAHQGKFTLFPFHLNIEADTGAEILWVFYRLRRWRLFMVFLWTYMVVNVQNIGYGYKYVLSSESLKVE